MLTPEEYLEKYGTKRAPRHIIKTYRIRNSVNHHPKFPGSLDHVIYVILFPKKLFKDPELYIYCYLPTYAEDIDANTELRNIDGLVLAEDPLVKLGFDALEEQHGKDFDEKLIDGDQIAISHIDDIVEKTIARYTFMGQETDYSVIQTPWNPSSVPPEESGSEVKNIDKKEENSGNLTLTEGAEIPPPPLRARGQYTLQVVGEEKLSVIGPVGNLVLFPNGTRIDIGELTLVKQEDPNDPKIISILNPENETFGDLDPEYIEELFTYDEGEEVYYVSSRADEKPTEQDLQDITLSAGTPTTLGKDADYWTLIAICALEAGSPQPRADVAQSIYNRLATPDQPYGSSIKAIITAKGQYEPAFIKGGKGAIGAKWKQIESRQTAIAAVMWTKGWDATTAGNSIDGSISALKDKTLQEEARKTVGTRTEFLGYRPTSSSATMIYHRSEKYTKASNGGNNYFFYAYAGKKLIGQNPPGAPDFSNFA